MKAMILAAGLGMRLRPLTLNIPKPLIPVAGLPLIFYNLALLKKNGITDVVINLHYLGDQIKQLLGDGSRFGFSFHYSEEAEILGTGGGIFRAKSYLKGSDQFLIINGDIITDLDLGDLIRTHQKNNAVATLAVIESAKAKDFGVLKVDESGSLTSILGKPDTKSKGRETFFSGIHIMNESLLDVDVGQKKFCIVREIYIPLLEKSAKLGGYLHTGYWNDLGTLDRLSQTEDQIRQISFSFQKEIEEFKKILIPH